VERRKKGSKKIVDEVIDMATLNSGRNGLRAFINRVG